jgi:hypothetical protein
VKFLASCVTLPANFVELFGESCCFQQQLEEAGALFSILYRFAPVKLGVLLKIFSAARTGLSGECRRDFWLGPIRRKYTKASAASGFDDGKHTRRQGVFQQKFGQQGAEHLRGTAADMARGEKKLF